MPAHDELHAELIQMFLRQVHSKSLLELPLPDILNKHVTSFDGVKSVFQKISYIPKVLSNLPYSLWLQGHSL